MERGIQICINVPYSYKAEYLDEDGSRMQHIKDQLKRAVINIVDNGTFDVADIEITIRND